MIDATRQLRWYAGLALLVAALAPLLMVTLLATDPDAPGGAVVPVFVGGPVNVAGLVFVVRGMLSTDPEVSARLLKIGAAVIAAGDVLLFVVRAFIT